MLKEVDISTDLKVEPEVHTSGEDVTRNEVSDWVLLIFVLLVSYCCLNHIFNQNNHRQHCLHHGINSASENHRTPQRKRSH